MEEGLAGGLFEAQADAVFPVEPAGVPVQDEAAVAVGVTTLTADHLWRGGLDGRVFRVLGMGGIVVVVGIVIGMGDALPTTGLKALKGTNGTASAPMKLSPANAINLIHIILLDLVRASVTELDGRSYLHFPGLLSLI